VTATARDNRLQVFDGSGLSEQMLDGLCGAMLGMFDGAGVSKLAGCLICGAVIGAALADEPEQVREEALRAVMSAARGIAAWQPTAPSTTRPQ
jgi:hypothetical protein